MKNTETKMSSPQKDSFRDRIATIDEKGKRKWIFAQKPKGKFYNIRSWVSWGFFALFFAIPFIKLNDRPLFLFNIPESEFIIFGKIFWPQDFVIFGLTMVTFIVFIVLFTAAFGRVFCGWVCPQTIFMEMLFRKVPFKNGFLFFGSILLRTRPWGDGCSSCGLSPWRKLKIAKVELRAGLALLCGAWGRPINTLSCSS